MSRPSFLDDIKKRGGDEKKLAHLNTGNNKQVQTAPVTHAPVVMAPVSQAPVAKGKSSLHDDLLAEKLAKRAAAIKLKTEVSDGDAEKFSRKTEKKQELSPQALWEARKNGVVPVTQKTVTTQPVQFALPNPRDARAKLKSSGDRPQLWDRTAPSQVVEGKGGHKESKKQTPAEEWAAKHGKNPQN